MIAKILILALKIFKYFFGELKKPFIFALPIGKVLKIMGD